VKTIPAFRLFWTVSRPATPLLVVFGVLSSGAIATEAIHPGSSDWVLASVLLIQLFSASSGFSRHASRGYYDPILVSGPDRLVLALSHFVCSAAPGLAAWAAVGAAQAVAARRVGVPALAPEGWIGLLLVSAVAWAASVRSAPFLGGALWLAVSAALLTSGKIASWLALAHADPSWAPAHPLRAIALGLALPILIPARNWPPLVLIGLGAAACAALAAGVLLVASAQFPLAEEGT